MAPSFFAVSATAALLEALLLWRLLGHGLLRRYPYFSAFVFYNLFCTLVAVAVDAFHPEWFAWTYWTAEVISIFLRFIVIWEIVRALFSPASALRRLTRSVLLAIGAFALPAIVTLAWTQTNLMHFAYRYVPPVFEQYLSLAQAALLLAIAVVARYYALPLGRNVRGLVFGLGLYLTLYAMNFASLQFVQGFLPYWQLLSPAMYIALTAFWLWSFWEYAPAPAQESAVPDPLESRKQWNQAWLTATSIMRRGHN